MTFLEAYQIIKEQHTDSYKIIGQKDGDMGDGAQRVGMFHTGMQILGFGSKEYNDYLEAINNLEVSPGIFVRHPVQWNDINDFSRDQQTPIVISMGFRQEFGPLRRILNKHLSRFGRYQNKDLASPEHFGFYIRAFKFLPLYPLLFLGDMFMLLNTLIICLYKGRDKDNVGDDLNHILSLLQAKLSMPTPISFLARILYIACRPSNYGNEKYHEKSAIQGALTWYFRPESGAPPIHEIYRPIIESHFS